MLVGGSGPRGVFYDSTALHGHGGRGDCAANVGEAYPTCQHTAGTATGELSPSNSRCHAFPPHPPLICHPPQKEATLVALLRYEKTTPLHSCFSALACTWARALVGGSAISQHIVLSSPCCCGRVIRRHADGRGHWLATGLLTAVSCPPFRTRSTPFLSCDTTAQHSYLHRSCEAAKTPRVTHHPQLVS